MKNKSLKSLLAIQTLALLIYTAFAWYNHGPNLLQVFFANITELGWSGQFNLDFLCYLTLSGLWIMWRNRFSTASIVLGMIAMVMGIVVFAPYMLYLLKKENGDIKRTLTGSRD